MVMSVVLAVLFSFAWCCGFVCLLLFVLVAC